MFALTVIDDRQLRYSIADKRKVHPICVIAHIFLLNSMASYVSTYKLDLLMCGVKCVST